MISQNQLQAYRQVGDDLADKLIAQIYADKENSGKIRQLMSLSMRNDEPIPEELPDYVHEYFRESAELPTWANLKQMERGAKFFEANAQEVMAMLGYYSLPYCYAAADGAKVLWMSERIQKDTLKRLTETGQFVFDVSEVGAFDFRRFCHSEHPKSEVDSCRHSLPCAENGYLGFGSQRNCLLIRKIWREQIWLSRSSHFGECGRLASEFPPKIQKLSCICGM